MIALFYSKLKEFNLYKLVLIRHGESLWNQENRFTGWQDVDLSKKVKVKLKKVAKPFAKEELHSISLTPAC